MSKGYSGALRPPYLLEMRVDAHNHRQRSDYPFNVPLLAEGEFRWVFSKPITIIVGENGSGKSTLLETIAHLCGFNLTGGSRNHVYEQRVDVAPLAKVAKLVWRPKVTTGFFMRAESFYTFSNYLESLADDDGIRNHGAFRPYGGRSLHEQSHGEAFFSLFSNRFSQKGIYLLDEPEAALSPARQLSFLRVLKELDEAGTSQVIMATHSPIIMSYPQAQLFEIKGDSLIERHFTETSHYRLMRRFMSDPDKTINEYIAD